MMVSPYVYPGLSGVMSISLDNILKACLKACNLSESELLSSDRSERVAICRTLYAHYACVNGYGLSEIGRRIKRNHATILYHRGKAKDLMEINDKRFMTIYNKVLING